MSCSLLVPSCSSFFSMGSEEAIDEPPHLCSAGSIGVIGEKRSRERALDPMLCSVGGTAREQEEPLLIRRAMPPERFGDIGAHGVRAADQLDAQRPLVERRPVSHCLAQIIGKRARASISNQVLEARHVRSSAYRRRLAPRATSNEQLATRSGPSV